MGCNCKERAIAIGNAVKGLRSGDLQKVEREVKFIARSATEDLRNVTAAAHQRLSTMRRR
jgi:hypothetical protein